jgi:hypothetical protein
MTISDLNKEKTFPQHQELFERVLDTIYEYEGEVAMVAVLGILDLIKDELKRDSDE